MKGILLTREDYIAFLQKKAVHKHIYPKATKSTTIHLMSITSKVIISYLAYHGDQNIWEKHISMANDTNAVYDTKMQTCKHDMYINPPNQSLKKAKRLQALLANMQMYLGPRASLGYRQATFLRMRSMFPFSTLSLRKWYLTSICLVLEWSIGFLQH
jgi:hypothetical protein